jgi:oligosaccharyltransferase complex subunit beta
LYEGIAQELDPHSQYLFPILKADDNSYSVNTKTGEYYNAGDKIKLVSAYQARNNRRVVISGSINICSDKFYFLSSSITTTLDTDVYNSPNSIFCQDLLNWNFQRTGVIRYENIRHQRVYIYNYIIYFNIFLEI